MSKTGGGSTTSYAWDWNNRLLSVSSVSSVVYEYDGDGTRISKTRAGVKTKYINDVAFSLVQVLMETDNSGAVQAIYNYGNDLISMNRADANSYYHYDGLGSVRLMTDDLCLVLNSYTYDSFGNSVASVSSVANPYGFTGEQQFGEADSMVFLRARYYKPSFGRFISRDPIGYRAGLNLYSYCKNNPINNIDPFGMWSSGCEYICGSLGAMAFAACTAAIGESCIGVGVCFLFGLAVYDACMDVCTGPWPPPPPPLPPIPPSFGEPSFPIPGYPYPPGYGWPFPPASPG